MSEQTMQEELFSNPVTILDKYTCLSLGATTINDLIISGSLTGVRVTVNLGKKPDVLIVDKSKQVVVFIEFKKPEEFNTERKRKKAIDQEIHVAKEVGAKIYVVTDGTTFIWLNPLTGKRIVDENGNEIRTEIKPKSDQKKLADYIERVMYSLSETSNTVLKIEDVDPTDLAAKIARILKRMTFATSKMSLYTFVEVFLFKYLSDIGVLRGQNSFDYIYKMYEKDNIYMTKADILGEYLEKPRAQMALLFPAAHDGTSIVNGQIFHVTKDVKTGHYIEEDSHAVCFEQIIKEFANYEKKNGKFINISKDFKSKLFETFMKNSDDKADMGQFFTPLKIVKEMVSMVSINNGSKICDPAAGVGKFLLESVASSSIDFEIKRKPDGSPDSLIKGVELFGFEKQMSGNDDITTILSKANMLIYFSKLFRENNDPDSVVFLSNELLNKTFYSSKTALGTLERKDKNMYDIILANPPYYPDATISNLAKNTGLYPANGKGVEGLFLEWIINALKYGGTANVILPEGIFANIGNSALKEKILNTCYIESVISLPINSFFNTSKKTYILTLKKKTKTEFDNNIKQDFKVFTYMCKTIGESLDVYRFDIDENDLHEATNKYNAYRNLVTKNNITEPYKSWFSSDKKMKLIDISVFDPHTNWNIDNFWTDEEKIELGFKQADNIMTVSEFQVYMEEIIQEMENYKEAVECLKK